VADVAQLVARFAGLYTGAIADVLDRAGCFQQTLPATIRPLRPGMRLAGPAYPVEGHPRPDADYDDSIRTTLEMLGAVPASHVAIYQTNGEPSAHLGELSVTSLKSRGVAGAVIDGGCRDVEFILREEFPVFCRHVTPQDCTHRWQVTGHGDVEIEVGSVRVARGDWVVADEDGCVVVPQELAADVLEEAEAMAATENEIRAAVRDGVTPLEAYERFGTF
jgi:4-hydroxy-4-methyl-2-oxoglutarate aldolase